MFLQMFHQFDLKNVIFHRKMFQIELKMLSLDGKYFRYDDLCG